MSDRPGLRIGLLCLALGCGFYSHAQDAAPALVSGAVDARQSAPARGPGHAAIASAHALATEAGLQILREGGNAFDAAVAVASTLSVVEPESSGLGGGFMGVLHQAADGRDVFIDARETSPAAVDGKDYRQRDGSADRDHSLNGPLSAAIPGEPAGLAWIAEHYGRLPLAHSLAPAIRVASEGFAPDRRLLDAIGERDAVLRRWPASAAKYLPGGQPPSALARLRDRAQAATLRRIAEHGAADFYRGRIARQLVAAVRKAGGNWSLADLADYRVRERAPLRIDYRGYRIVTAPPPSSGGVAIAEILNILAGFPLDRLDQAARVHYVVEAMRRAFRDHNDYLGDPAFVKMPLEMLLSPYYADGLRQSILADRATPSSMLPTTSAVDPGMHTTHFSVIDADGNMVSITATVNYFLGSSFVAGDTGVLLNDEMDDFALVPGQPNVYGLLGSVANAPRPGKRPLSSMSPSLVFGPGRVAALGTPGGSTIITQVLEGILAFIDGKSAAQIAAQPRYHHQFMPDRIDVEPGAFDAPTRAALERMGYTVQDREPWGYMNVVTWDLRDNRLDAASDPRWASGLGKLQ